MSSHHLTSIAVSHDVKRALASRGSAGESFNTVLKRLLDLKEEKKSQADKVRGHSQPATAQTTYTGGQS